MSNGLLISSSTEEERDYIQSAIIAYNNENVPFTQKIAFEELNYVAKNEKGEIIAGINSLLYSWGILYLDTLWVHEKYRFKKIGTQLLQKVQETAKRKGCSLIHLETMDFQAKEFYTKHGYEIYGVLEDCPPGHTRFSMKKKL